MTETYVFIIDVTVKAVKGVPAINQKIRGVGITDLPNARVTLEERAIEDVRKAYEKKYPGIPIQLTAKSQRIEQKFLIVET